jgi:geranylgeranyl diphosphate synthase type II
MSASTATLDETLKGLQVEVNSRLEHYVNAAAGVPPRLRDAMAYSLLAGGKRLRPVLALLACEAVGGSRQQALPVACSIEMIHTYSLIHDDLPAMDNDDLRRGKPTNHKVYGEALAILAGDGLLTLAFEITANEVLPPETAAACCADLARAAGMAGMVGGQAADLEAEGRTLGTVEELEAIHRRKTGALLSCALTVGGRVGRASNDSLWRLSQFGKCLGLAFQIVDDLLDVRGSAKCLGKSVRKDAGRGKLTYPALLGAEVSAVRAQCLVAEACQWIEPMGERARPLEALARFVLDRNH